MEEAVNELLLAIEDDPGHIQAYMALAAIYEELQRFDEALDAYRQALRVNIDEPRVNYRLGALLMRLGLFVDALTPLRMAWSNDQKNAQVAASLAFALDKSGDYSTARLMYETVLKLNPGLHHAHLNLGNLHFRQKRYESAIASYVMYMAKAGETSRAHRNIGKSQSQLGQLDSALQSFQKAATLDTENPKNYYSIARVQFEKGNLEDSIRNFQTVLHMSPDHQEARYSLSKTYKQSGRISEAISELHILLHSNPSHYKALNTLATCHIITRNYVDAVGTLNQALALAPDYADAHYNLGIAMTNMVNYEGALFHFQQAVRLDPADEAAAAAIARLHSRIAQQLY